MMLVKKLNGDVVDTKAPKDDLPIGMTVKIKDYKTVKKICSEGGRFDAGFTSSMMRFCGKRAKIVNRFKIFSQGIRYFLNIDNEQYKWTIAMFDWENKLVFENE